MTRDRDKMVLDALVASTEALTDDETAADCAEDGETIGEVAQRVRGTIEAACDAAGLIADLEQAAHTLELATNIGIDEHILDREECDGDFALVKRLRARAAALEAREEHEEDES